MIATRSRFVIEREGYRQLGIATIIMSLHRNMCGRQRGLDQEDRHDKERQDQESPKCPSPYAVYAFRHCPHLVSASSADLPFDQYNSMRDDALAGRIDLGQATARQAPTPGETASLGRHPPQAFSGLDSTASRACCAAQLTRCSP